jgi:hypothetical protein
MKKPGTLKDLNLQYIATLGRFTMVSCLILEEYCIATSIVAVFPLEGS